MSKKINQIYADLQKYVNRFEQAFDDQLAAAVGFKVRERMLQFISGGQSPILGKGRFPEYLAVTRNRKRKDARKGANKNLRINRKQTRFSSRVGGSRLKDLRAERKLLTAAKNKLTTATKDGYPYNTKEYRRGTKRPRPVNLFLSGEFLEALTFIFRKSAGKQRLTIGWFERRNSLKEKGHREGAGGQPKRPTLPVGNEAFNQTIQLDIMKLLRDAVRKVAKVTK